MPPTPTHLQPDCSACSGLCCVVLPFDAAQGFGFDKAAHTPCQHLQANFRCEIHADLNQRGFSGCVQYNCYGAGQATMQLLNQITWTNSSEHAERMFDIFTRLRPIHELLAMLSLALSYTEEPLLKTALQNAIDQLDTARESESSITDSAHITHVKANAQTALRQFSQSAVATRLKDR